MASGAVAKFEKTFAQWYGVKSAFAFWKGRVAIYAILRVLGVGEGDEVILPGYTCVTAVNPIKFIGAKPVYVDIEPVTYGMDPDKIEEKITPRTKVIFAQYTYGYPPELDTILDIANRHGIPVMEDACQGLGTIYKGRKSGSFGIAAGWSMQWTKTFTAGIGGLATTNDTDLAGKIEGMLGELRKPGLKESTLLSIQRMVYRAVIFPKTTAMITSMYRWMVRKKVLVGSSTTAETEGLLQIDPHFFKAMSTGQARSGLRQIPRRLEANIRHRREMTALYEKLLAERDYPVPKVPDYIDPVLVRYPIRVADKAGALELARQRHVELGEWFDQPLHQCSAPLSVYDYAEGMCPEAEKAVREVANFPTHVRCKRRHAVKAVDLVCEIGPPKQ